MVIDNFFNDEKKEYIGVDKTIEEISKLQLKEEKLDIIKKWVQTGEVDVHREVFQEIRNYSVPITCEELVIEKKIFDRKAQENGGDRIETIRIPISEERVEIVKFPVALEEVSVYNRHFEEIVTVEETLKREELRIENSGNPEIVD